MTQKTARSTAITEKSNSEKYSLSLRLRSLHCRIKCKPVKLLPKLILFRFFSPSIYHQTVQNYCTTLNDLSKSEFPAPSRCNTLTNADCKDVTNLLMMHAILFYSASSQTPLHWTHHTHINVQTLLRTVAHLAQTHIAQLSYIRCCSPSPWQQLRSIGSMPVWGSCLLSHFTRWLCVRSCVYMCVF